MVMPLVVTPEVAAFRQEVRQFIERNLPVELNRAPGRGNFDHADADGPPEEEHPEALQRWREANRKQGWLAPAWPKEYGGGGLNSHQQFVLNDEYIKAGAPRFFGIGLAMAGPTILIHGTEQQKRTLLPPILETDERWVELFSEPGSGSDLASLQTRAVRDGDDYVVNGTKIWTSGAQRADKAILMARTDPAAPKHRGISMLILDMHSPGVTVQPLVNLTGTAGSFNQEFFEDVRVPASNLIGEENRGWYYVMTTLDVERSAIAQVASQERTFATLLELAQSPRFAPLAEPVRREVADRAIELHVLRGLSERMVDLQARNLVPNHEASVLKLFHTELSVRMAATAMKIIGPYGMLYRGTEQAPLDGMVPYEYLYASSRTIQVGTSEVQRNIIATRGLGLPRG
jgi:alkylation response protein AidB-like acyl-CoA dehydrogenase